LNGSTLLNERLCECFVWVERVSRIVGRGKAWSGCGRKGIKMLPPDWRD
jgi:hypothetical protein